VSPLALLRDVQKKKRKGNKKAKENVFKQQSKFTKAVRALKNEL
jgi:hypothetical protein